jgi:hypothetical protein
LGTCLRRRASKRRLLAYGLGDHYVEIFDITRLDGAITIREPEVEAVQAVTAL